MPAPTRAPAQKQTVAVLGSCATRDIFDSRFNPGYKEYFECVALADTVSIVSLMAAPIDVSETDLPELDTRNQGLLVNEFRRTFLDDIAKLQPDVLVIDLWPEIMFGFAELGDDLVSRNFWTTIKTDFYKSAAPVEHVMHKDVRRYLEVWKPAVDKLFAFIGERSPLTRVVLHSPRNASSWIDGAGEVQTFDPFYASLNKNWQTLDDYLVENHVNDVISVFTPDTKSFEGHPWGKYSVHYTFDYHAKFLAELIQVCFGRDHHEGRASAKSFS